MLIIMENEVVYFAEKGKIANINDYTRNSK
jgi:hypothetical protein